MKCVIPGANCKILGRAIHALAKIGEEMYVQPREKSLSFRCVSLSNSAYCDFTFQDTFFSSYSFGDLEEEDALKCKITMVSALTVFKSPANIDRIVETCHIWLQPNATELIFILKFKNGVRKTFYLPIIDCEQLSVAYTKDNMPNKLSAKPRILCEVLQNFQQNLVEITLEVTPQKLLMRNYVDENSTIANSTRTQLALTIGEFDEYKIGTNTCITFCLKELRAMLTFAESVQLPLNVYFEITGRPVLFDTNCQTFDANLVLATSNPAESIMSASIDSAHRNRAKKRAPPKKTPRQSARASSKRPPKKSIFSDKSVSNTTNTTAIVDSPRPMEMDVETASTSAVDGDHLSRLDLPVEQNKPSKRISERSSVVRGVSLSQNTSIGRASRCQSPVVSTLNATINKSSEPSIFSPSWKKWKEAQNNVPEEQLPDEPMDEDIVPGSPTPPTSKTKTIFRRCLEQTFDPRTLPGYDVILGEDTDEEN